MSIPGTFYTIHLGLKTTTFWTARARILLTHPGRHNLLDKGRTKGGQGEQGGKMKHGRVQEENAEADDWEDGGGGREVGRTATNVTTRGTRLGVLDLHTQHVIRSTHMVHV